MEFQKETGRIYAEQDGKLIAEITFPEENGMGRSVSVEWVDAPHFYLYRNAIVQYIGSDSQLLLQLESLCGPPFAGEGSDKNGYTSQALTLE